MAGTARVVQRHWGNTQDRDNFLKQDAAQVLFEEHDKIIADLEVLRAAASTGGVGLVNERRTNNDLIRLWEIEVGNDHETMRDFHNFHERDGIVFGNPEMVQGSTTDRVSFSAFSYRINGELFHTAAQANISPGTTTINTGAAASALWGALYFTIDRNGVITVTAMDDANTDQVAVTEFAAIERLNAHANNALPANEVLIAILTVQCTASQTVVFDTEVLNVSDNSIDVINFYSMVPDVRAEIIVGSAAESKVVTAHSGLTAGSAATTYNLAGAAVVKVNGRRDASAASATQAFTVADVINSGGSGNLFGGWLVLKGIDGGDTKFTLSSDGVPEAEANAAESSSAAVQTLLDALVISPLCVKVGQIIIETTDAIFTANTTNTDAPTAFVGVAQAASTAYEEGVAGAVRGIVAPTLPALLSNSPVPAAVLAAASTTAIDAAGDMTAATIATT